ARSTETFELRDRAGVVGRWAPVVSVTLGERCDAAIDGQAGSEDVLVSENEEISGRNQGQNLRYRLVDTSPHDAPSCPACAASLGRVLLAFVSCPARVLESRAAVELISFPRPLVIEERDLMAIEPALVHHFA